MPRKECNNCKILPQEVIIAHRRVLVAKLEVKVTKQGRAEWSKQIKWWEKIANQLRRCGEEVHREGQKETSATFRDLEKGYDRLLSKGIWNCMRERDYVPEKYVKTTHDTCKSFKTAAHSATGEKQFQYGCSIAQTICLDPLPAEGPIK